MSGGKTSSDKTVGKAGGNGAGGNGAGADGAPTGTDGAEPAPRRTFSSGVTPDGRLARLVVEQPGKRKLTLQALDAAEVDAMIESLAAARMRMHPPVPDQRHVGENQFLPAYQWSGIGVRANGKRPLAIRHPGYGWFGLLMPDEDAAKLAAWATGPMIDDTPIGTA